MVGVSEQVAAQYTEGGLLALLDTRPGGADRKGIYQRGQAGDRTGPLPLRHHARQVAQGWQLVQVVDEPGTRDTLNRERVTAAVLGDVVSGLESIAGVLGQVAGWGAETDPDAMTELQHEAAARRAWALSAIRRLKDIGA
jgi:hypothetical protein